jgi:Tol biopolymer transport system component
VAIVLLALAATAHAAFPGANGKVVFAGSTGDQSEPRQIFTVNPDGTGTSDLTGTMTDGCHSHSPSWSPNGTKIAFARERFNGTDCVDYDLWVMNANGTSPSSYNGPGNETQPVWSPDGTKLASVSGGDVYSISRP